MEESQSGIEAFGDQLPQAVLRDIESWTTHPELGRLHAILHAHTDRPSFLNTYAEAIVARHLLAHDCELRFEVPTPSGRRVDFEVTRNGQTFHLHVKRLSTQGPAKEQAGRAAKVRLTVSSRLRILERIQRPYIVSIRWKEGLNDRQMQHLVTRGGQFIEHARVGDELSVRDDRTDQEIGGFRMMAPWDGPHVSLVIGMPAAAGTHAGGFADESPRIRKLLKKAYLQFMPRQPNVILMGTSHERDAVDFETALLGSHIERWDAVPPTGKRIAHGRAEDGFWNAGHYEQSQAAAWFRFSMTDTVISPHLWLRNGPPAPPSPTLPVELLRDLLAKDGAVK